MKNFADLHIHISETEFKKCEEFLDEIASQGVTHASILSLAYCSVISNLSVLYWKTHYKNLKISAFGAVHREDLYKEIPFETQAKALVEMGCDGGIKMLYPPKTRKKLGYGINDPKYEKMFTYLEENNIPLVIHVNDPESFRVPRELTALEKERDWGYFDGTFLSKQEIYDKTFVVLDKHPKLRVTFAHFFFLLYRRS